MDRWTCPKCRREFGKTNQRHTCEPGLTVAQYFEISKPWERPIFDVVSAHLLRLGEVIIDPISIGILFKHGPMFCELRAMTNWTALGFYLDHKLTSSKLSRKVIDHNGRYMHYINVREVAQIDDQVLDWLSDSYFLVAGNSLRTSSLDPMVPDDVDDDIF